tara:strand:- start:70 stop:477 length:408 start_codon:yes stop_codon:yes gene_type:complete
MSLAETWSEMSRARRKKVGCIIVKDNQIISDGYNGTPHGFDNDCEFVTRFGWETKPEVLHAESNALTKLAKSTQSSLGATVYITLMPCYECAKLMIQSGIKRVIYNEKYRDPTGVNILIRAGIEVNQLNGADASG